MMKVNENHLLEDDKGLISFVESPNVGGELEPKYLVMHYTAGQSAQGAVSWFLNPNSHASAHLVIGRDGRITQMVPFNRVAWHAGESAWEGLVGLNQHAIGIELDNAGRLKRRGDRWRAWFGREYKQKEVLEDTHKHDTKTYGWHLFPPEQIEVALEVASALINHYGLLDVVGHDDISPRRKWDPGPAFPMHSFRSKVMGRRRDGFVIYQNSRRLHIRQGPGTHHELVQKGALKVGTSFEIVESEGSWALVNVLDEVGGKTDVQGWIFTHYLQRAGTATSDPD